MPIPPHGVTLSVTALASGLAVQSAKAAPPALLKSAAAKALGGAATYSTTSLTLFMAMKSQATLPIALLLLLSPLGLQQLAISRAAAHNDRLRETVASLEPAARSTLERTPYHLNSPPIPTHSPTSAVPSLTGSRLHRIICASSSHCGAFRRKTLHKCWIRFARITSAA
jgi:hypothetical protein